MQQVGASLKDRILETGDPNSRFNHQTAQGIFDELGPAPYLLSRSSKGDKSRKKRVESRSLFMTSAIFCRSSTPACRASCLGHTSGMLHWPQATRARDQRAAYYLCDRQAFIKQLRKELATHEKSAKRRGLAPAVRLNGTSDIAWELLHPELFELVPEISYFDYTKHFVRAKRAAEGEFPKNYSICYSGQRQTEQQARRILALGGNVSVVFWPKLPSTWWWAPVIDGDETDTRFMDPAGTVIGLMTKGIAKTETLGLTIRPCPACGPEAPELRQISQAIQLEQTWVRVHGKVKRPYRRTLHRCDACGYELRARNMLSDTQARHDALTSIAA